jgi:septum formation protein
LIYLASQSPRRAQLLQQIGMTYELLVHDEFEDAEGIEAVLPNETALKYVQRVTQLKLDAALLRRQRRGLAKAPVLCADTTVALGRQILGKPANQHDAIRMLTLLAGRTHRVLTAVAVQSGRSRSLVLSQSQVTFAPMSQRDVLAYVKSGEPMGKAGAYAVQGRAAIFIARISGSYSGIMGLPVYETAQLLKTLKVKIG